MSFFNPVMNPFNLTEDRSTTVNLSVVAANVAEAYELLDQKVDKAMNEDVDYVVQAMEIDESEDGNFVFKAVLKVYPKKPEPKPLDANKYVSRSDQVDEPNVPDPFKGTPLEKLFKEARGL